MKKILSILGAIGLTATPIASTVSFIPKNISYKIAPLDMNSEDSVNNLDYNPFHPSYLHSWELDASPTTDEAIAYYSKDLRTWSETQEIVYEIDASKHAKDRESFIKHFDRIDISVRMEWKRSQGSDNFKIGNWTLDPKVERTFYSEDDALVDREYGADGFEASATYISTKWEGDIFKITIRAHSYIFVSNLRNPGNLSSSTKAHLVKNDLIRNSASSYIPDLKTNLENDFAFISNTSAKIDSTENYKIIEKHVDDVLKESLLEDYDTWMTYVRYHLTFDYKKNLVTVVFFDINGKKNVSYNWFLKTATFKVDLTYLPSSVHLDLNIKSGIANSYYSEEHSTWSQRQDIIYEIDASKYAIDRETFIKYYGQLKLNVEMKWWRYLGRSGSKQATWTVNTEQDRGLSWGDDVLEDSEGGEESRATFETAWVGNILRIRIRHYSNIWLPSGDSGQFISSSSIATLKSITLESVDN